MAESPISALGDLLSQPEGSWTLTDGLVAIAGISCGTPRDTAIRTALREYGALARKAIGAAEHPRFVAGAIAEVLFGVDGFSLDEADDTPDSRLIDRAIESRVASPILMAAIYVECSRLAGISVDGTSLPGPLVLRIQREDAHCYVESSGRFPLLSPEELQERVHQRTDGRLSFNESGLAGITTSQLLARLIRDLKSAYWARADYDHALEAIEMILTIRPEDPRELRDQGKTLLLLGRTSEAIGPLETCLAIDPRGQEAESIRRMLVKARAALVSRHS